VNFAVHFIKAKSSLIICAVSFILHYLLEGKKRIVGGEREGEVGEIDQFSITERIVFHILFML